MRVDKSKWQKKTIGQIGKVISGSTPRTDNPSNWEGGTYNWVTPAELKGDKYYGSTIKKITDTALESTNLTLMPIGTVLLSSRAPIGKVAITTEPMYCNQGFKNIECNSSIHNEFLYYYLRYNNDELNRRGNGVTFKEISKKIVEQFPVIVPSLEEQKGIASELDAIQAMIDGYKAQIMDLDELIESIFNKTFGDISINDMNWEITSMGKLGNFKNGLNYEKGEKGKVLKFIGVGDFQNNKYLSSSSILSTIELESISEEYLLKDEDIVFVRSNGNKNLVGRCLEVFPNGIEVTYSGFCIRFRKTANIINKYLLSVLTDSSFKKTHILKSNGIGIQNINQKLLSNLPIPIPPIELQKKFESQVDSINTQKALLWEQLKDAEQLMAERMQYYFS